MKTSINMIQIKKIIREGEICHPWYYGHSYFDWPMNVRVMHPIPINFIVRFIRQAKFWWDCFRLGKSHLDKLEDDIRSKVYHNYWTDVFDSVERKMKIFTDANGLYTRGKPPNN